MTPIADKFGRKRTFLMNACASSVVVFVTALINNYYVFTSLRFLLGIFLQVRYVADLLITDLIYMLHQSLRHGNLAYTKLTGNNVFAGSAINCLISFYDDSMKTSLDLCNTWCYLRWKNICYGIIN